MNTSNEGSATCASHHQELDRAKFALTVRFHAKTEHRDAFRAKLVERVLAARRDDAVVDFRLFATDDPDIFLVFESFLSEDAWVRFSRAPDTTAFLASVADMQACPYQVQRLALVGW